MTDLAPDEHRLFATNMPPLIAEAFDRISLTALDYVIERLRRDEDSLKSLYDLITTSHKEQGIEIRIGDHMRHQCKANSYVGVAVLEIAKERRLIGLIDINSPAMLDEIVADPREVIRRMTYPALVTCAVFMQMIVVNGKGDYQEWRGDRSKLVIPLERMRKEISSRKLDAMFAAVMTAQASKRGFI